MTTVESSELIVRATSLYLPITIAIAFAIHVRPDRRRVAGALLATVWNVPALLAVNLVAARAGWWSFATDTATVSGVPADLWVGWALLWGAVPILATTRLAGLLALGVACVVADLVLMPLAEPVVVLDATWFVGEMVAVATCLIPGLLLGRWTAMDARLGGRVLLQVVAFTALLFLVVPSLIFTITDETWDPLLDRPRWHFGIAAVLLAPVGAMALQAVLEFAAHGGTPVPLDPPKRQVTTGPYAYLANPMQLAATILLGAWGLLLGSAAVVVAAATGAGLSAGLFAWNEEGDLAQRFGDGWHSYRKQVRLWLPSWRPTVFDSAVVYVAGTCQPCSQVGRFLTSRHPTGLDVRPAEQCPFRLRRITYHRAHSRTAGIAAIGRSLEHVNIAWAAASWIGRLPGIEQVLQLIADAVGTGPRSIAQPHLDAGARSLDVQRCPVEYACPPPGRPDVPM
jgi:protein-S-isoprenylcysteine O-methyltransferase Ste14